MRIALSATCRSFVRFLSPLENTTALRQASGRGHPGVPSSITKTCRQPSHTLRDSGLSLELHAARGQKRDGWLGERGSFRPSVGTKEGAIPVSYTHLTLPTIYSV